MDNFINLIKNTRDIKNNVAENTIIRGLMVQNKRQNDKLEDLDSYDSESLFNGKMYRGNMYIFTYNAKNPTKYSYKGEDVYFTDSLPVVLMTGETQSTIRGINLNFCNKALKTLILNILTNMDEDFYFGDLAQKQAFNRQAPISEKVYRFLSSNDAEEKIIEELNRAYPGIDYKFIFRNYAVTNIKNIRLIEPWQWKYIPFLNYDSFDKGDTLKAIQKISGIDTIHI